MRTKEQKKEYDRLYYITHRQQILDRSSAHHRKYRLITNERQRRYHHRKAKWRLVPGWNKELYDETLRKQNGLCAVCEKLMNPPVRDHDHKTDKARGLLCHPCNKMLGDALDNSATLIAGANYLERTTNE